jgi:hypothetical protein
MNTHHELSLLLKNSDTNSSLRVELSRQPYPTHPVSACFPPRHKVALHDPQQINRM